MPLHIGDGGKSISGSASKVGGLSSSASKVGGLSGSASKVRVGVCSSGDVFGAAAVNAVKGDGEAGKGERGEGEDTMGAKNAMMTRQHCCCCHCHRHLNATINQR